MSKVITIGNFKGGVGKTTLTELISYILEKRNNKVLVIDTDPQSNITDKLINTYNKVISKNDIRLMQSIKQADLKLCIKKLSHNLDLCLGDWTIEEFEHYVKDHEKAQYYLLHTLISKIKHNYDYVLIDTRPSTNVMTNNAICSSDYVIITSKTEYDSYNSTIKYIDYLKSMRKYNKDFDLLGIINYLVNVNGYVDNKIIDQYNHEFGKIMFKTKVVQSEVVKRWGYEGITEHKPYDKIVLKNYRLIVDEILERIDSNE